MDPFWIRPCKKLVIQMDRVTIQENAQADENRTSAWEREKKGGKDEKSQVSFLEWGKEKGFIIKMVCIFVSTRVLLDGDCS